MRMVKLEKIEYPEYTKIRDALYKMNPLALANQMYIDSTQTAYFKFEDTKFIPPILVKFIIKESIEENNPHTDIRLALVDAYPEEKEKYEKEFEAYMKAWEEDRKPWWGNR